MHGQQIGEQTHSLYCFFTIKMKMKLTKLSQKVFWEYAKISLYEKRGCITFQIFLTKIHCLTKKLWSKTTIKKGQTIRSNNSKKF